MKKGPKKITLSRETLRTLDPTQSGVVGAYPLSTATNCDQCWTYGDCATISCDTNCYSWCFC